MRPSKVAPIRGWVAEQLEQDPAVATLDLFRRARELGQDVGRSQFYALVADVRPSRRSGVRGPDLETRARGPARGRAPIRHGTSTAYGDGCRCQACRDAYAAYRRAYRAAGGR